MAPDSINVSTGKKSTELGAEPEFKRLSKNGFQGQSVTRKTVSYSFPIQLSEINLGEPFRPEPGEFSSLVPFLARLCQRRLELGLL